MVQMMEGTLEEEAKTQWGWDKEVDERGSNDFYWPKRELSDVEGYEGDEKMR